MLIRSMSPLKLRLAQVLLYVFMKESGQAEEDGKEEERAGACGRDMVNPATAPSLKQQALMEKEEAAAQLLWWMR